MATYAIGDIQGCWEPLQRLLQVIRFDPGHDRLWLTGDLVNRGPGSLEVLRWAASLDRLVAVLGNHDLHLLAAAEGLRRPKRRDTLAPVLEAPDRDDLLAWLWARPLLHREGAHLLVHAGLLPEWSADRAAGIAEKAMEFLRAGGLSAALPHVASASASQWDEKAGPGLRAAAALGAFTHLRCLDSTGAMDFTYAGPPATAPSGLVPWHEAPARRSPDVTVVCGHWAAQGLVIRDDLIALDTGCVWGATLTACRLDDGAIFSVPASPA